MRRLVESLQEKAAFAVIAWTFVGIVPGLFLLLTMERFNTNSEGDIFFMILLFGTMAGILVGESRAKDFRARAEHYLCTMELERNLGRYKSEVSQSRIAEDQMSGNEPGDPLSEEGP